tara:strand:+ start:774 stop:1472 length:699 start_codon:yes stop_codon:yes gene_type:complete
MNVGKHIWYNTLRVTKFSYYHPLWYNHLKKKGFVILKNIKPKEDNLIKVTSHLGAILDSPYGKFWDTTGKNGIKTNDLAYQKCELEPHTDMNYLKKTPKLQIFCAENPAPKENGGETILLDGLAIRHFYKRNLPYHYNFLTRHFYEFRCSEKKHSAYKNIFPDKGFIHFNPYDIIDNNCYNFHLVKSLTQEPCFQIKFRLEKNDLLIMNNHRILHGRTAFTGNRNLVGCYIS